MNTAAKRQSDATRRQQACHRVLSYRYNDISVWSDDFKTTKPSLISVSDGNSSPRQDGLMFNIYDFGQMQ